MSWALITALVVSVLTSGFGSLTFVRTMDKLDNKGDTKVDTPIEYGVYWMISGIIAGISGYLTYTVFNTYGAVAAAIASVASLATAPVCAIALGGVAGTLYIIFVKIPFAAQYLVEGTSDKLSKLFEELRQEVALLDEQQAGPPVKGTCPVCSKELSIGKVVYCKECDVPHHEDCWKYNERCGIMGCGCTTFCIQPKAKRSKDDYCPDLPS